MVSKIIQKEKERQEEFLEYLFRKPSYLDTTMVNVYEEVAAKQHKRSLINLKKYIEDIYNYFVMWLPHQTPRELQKTYEKKLLELKNDIRKLTKMIERYTN
jgi:hypothetical protein